MKPSDPAKSAEHEQAWPLLSRYILNALDGRRTDFVKRHLRTCSVCRRELAEMEALARHKRMAQLQDATPPDIDRALDADRHEPPGGEHFVFPTPLPPRPHWSRSVETLLGPGRLLLSVALAFMLLLVYFLLSGRPEIVPVMSGAETRHADREVRAQFVPKVAAGEIEALLAPLRCDILAGPDKQGFYRLRGRGMSTEEFLERLRATGKIRVAEPVATVGEAPGR